MMNRHIHGARSLVALLVAAPFVSSRTAHATLEDAYWGTSQCQVGQADHPEGAGAGLVTQVVVCPIEDWWVPGSGQAAWSPQGRVITGYSYPVPYTSGTWWYDRYHDKTLGQATSSAWRALEAAAPGSLVEDYFSASFKQFLYNHSEDECVTACKADCEALHCSGGPTWNVAGCSTVTAYNTCYANCYDLDWTPLWDTAGSGFERVCTASSPRFVRKELYVPLVMAPTNGSNTPSYLAGALSSVPDALTDFDTWCAGVTECNTPSGADATLLGDLYADWTGFPDSYTWWHPTWRSERADFLQRFADYLALLDPYGQVTQVNMNAESGWLPYLVSWGYWPIGDLDQELEDYAVDALAIEDLRDKYIFNIAMGGRAFHTLAAIAADPDAYTPDPSDDFKVGIATHGSTSQLSHQFLQHLAHLEYDETYKSYKRLDGPSAPFPYSWFHVDLENLDQTAETWEQYRLFRLTALAGIAHGANSLLVTNSTIPAEGRYQTAYCPNPSNRACNFDWSEIGGEGAPELLQWMNKLVGRDVASSPEVYCALVTYGVENTTSTPVLARLATLKSDPDTWGQTDDLWSYASSLGNPGRGWDSADAYVRSPEVTHFGRGCLLDTTLTNSEGTPALEMAGGGISAGTGLIEDVPTPSISNWVFGNTYPYEARTTQAPTGTVHALYFHIDDGWANAWSDEVAVKVTYTSPDTASTAGLSEWRLEYRTQIGWETSQEVEWDPTRVDTAAPTGHALIRTATFRIALPDFADHTVYSSSGGSGDVDLVIRHLAGEHPAILNVRVVRIP